MLGEAEDETELFGVSGVRRSDDVRRLDDVLNDGFARGILQLREGYGGNGGRGGGERGGTVCDSYLDEVYQRPLARRMGASRRRRLPPRMSSLAASGTRAPSTLDS